MKGLEPNRLEPEPDARAGRLQDDDLKRPIVVALDGQDHDADALALAGVLCRALGGELLIVHAIASPLLARGMAEYELIAWQEGRELLARSAKEVGPITQTQLVEGWPAAVALGQLAEDHGACIVVLGSSHRGSVGSLVPGRTAALLIARASFPVAVAPSGYAATASNAVDTIGVAYDVTDESDVALAAAVAVALRLGVPLRLYHAMHSVPDGHSWDKFRENMHEFAQRILACGLRQVPDGIATSAVVLEGDPAAAIAQAATLDQVGLMYVGSRGYGPLHEALVHGVVGGLLHTARTALVIVPDKITD